jgi:RecB family exonuclease
MLQYFVKWCAERKSLGCTPFAAEKEFEIEVANGRKLKGFIDRIDLTPSGDYEVFDYKTGKSMLSGNSIKKDIQMNGYSLAVKSLYGRLPSTASLLYMRNEKSVVYDIRHDIVEDVKQDISSLVSDVLAEKFSPTPDPFICRFCDYRSICDSREIEDDV